MNITPPPSDRPVKPLPHLPSQASNKVAKPPSTPRPLPPTPKAQRPLQNMAAKPISPSPSHSIEPISNQREFNPLDKISRTWRDGKGNEAEEIIQPEQTVENLKSQIFKELAYLEEAGKRERNPTRLKKIEARKAHLMELKSRVEPFPNPCIYSGYYRGLFRGEKELAPSEPFDNRLKAYQRIIREKYLPLPVNMNTHSVQVTKEEGHPKSDPPAKIVQLGVISDFSNGYTHLRELKEMENRPDLKEEVQKRIQTISKKEEAKGNAQVGLSAHYALDQIKSSESIAKAISERREHLRRAFLQLVVKQVENGSAEELEGKNFTLMHVLLLNHRSRQIDKVGFCHDEAHEALDMAEIFDEFDDTCKLLFDGKGPFIDLDGNIHLPKVINDANGQSKTMNLRALILANSIQGHTKNDGVSLELNNKAIGKLKALLPPEKASEFQKILEAKETDVKSAIDLIDIGRQSGFKVSTSCLSGKDRTGIVTAAWAVLKGMSTFPASSKQRFMRRQMLPGSPATKLLWRNSRADAMKLSMLYIPGLTDNIKGFILRLGLFPYQGIEIAKENWRIRKEMRVKSAKTAKVIPKKIFESFEEKILKTSISRHLGKISDFFFECLRDNLNRSK